MPRETREPEDQRILFLTPTAPDDLRRAATLLDTALEWYTTIEGDGFWGRISTRLGCLSRGEYSDGAITERYLQIRPTESPIIRNASQLMQVAITLMSAFDWDSTHEGGDFWTKVHRRIKFLAELRPRNTPVPTPPELTPQWIEPIRSLSGRVMFSDSYTISTSSSRPSSSVQKPALSSKQTKLGTKPAWYSKGRG